MTPRDDGAIEFGWSAAAFEDFYGIESYEVEAHLGPAGWRVLQPPEVSHLAQRLDDLMANAAAATDPQGSPGVIALRTSKMVSLGHRLHTPGRRRSLVSIAPRACEGAHERRVERRLITAPDDTPSSSTP